MAEGATPADAAPILSCDDLGSHPGPTRPSITIGSTAPPAIGSTEAPPKRSLLDLVKKQQGAPSSEPIAEEPSWLPAGEAELRRAKAEELKRKAAEVKRKAMEAALAAAAKAEAEEEAKEAKAAQPPQLSSTAAAARPRFVSTDDGADRGAQRSSQLGEKAPAARSPPRQARRADHHQPDLHHGPRHRGAARLRGS